MSADYRFPKNSVDGHAIGGGFFKVLIVGAGDATGGPINLTLSGVNVGDKVLGVTGIGVAYVANVAADCESTISIVNNLVQTGNNHTGHIFQVFILTQS
jgi:hypothetical protein